MATAALICRRGLFCGGLGFDELAKSGTGGERRYHALSAVADDDPGLVAVPARADQMAIPVIVLGEYRYGIAQSRNQSAYEAWLTELLNDCMVLDINEPTSHYYSEIVVELKRKGKPILTNDIWIAALCRQHSLPLVTRDRHFDWVEGNSRVGW